MGIIPDKPAPTPRRAYYLHSASGHYLAVEFLGWLPARAIGPLNVADLSRPIDSLDWANAMVEHGLNVRFLVEIDEREHAFVRSGRSRLTSPHPVRGRGTGAGAMRLAQAGIPR